MVASMKIEYYPLWMEENPELFAKSKVNFMQKATEANLKNIEEYWRFGLFYIEATSSSKTIGV